MIAKNLMAAFAAGAFGISIGAHAALGGMVQSVQADKSAMGAKAPAIRFASPSYTVHEMQTPSGTMVREYASLDGQIFAIAWQGPTLPDIQQLLGMYFERFVGAMQGRRPGQRHVSVRQSDLVVESHGRMGAFFGQAYLPRSLPQGVTPDMLQ